MNELLIESFTLGEWMTNCYVVHVRHQTACWIIDAGYDPLLMIDYIKNNNLEPKQVILTHGHLDHIAGLSGLRAVWPKLPILIHPAEQQFPGDPALNLSIMIQQPIVGPDPTGTIEHDQTLTLGGIDFLVKHTPGHSPGGITLYQPIEAVAIVGDTLFAGSIGRYDFPTSDGATLMKSIYEQLMTLPDDTRVLAGHGPDTTIGKERDHNPFLQSS